MVPNTHKILSNIFLSLSSPYAEKITGALQYGFWCNKSISVPTFIRYWRKTGII